MRSDHVNVVLHTFSAVIVFQAAVCRHLMNLRTLLRRDNSAFVSMHPAIGSRGSWAVGQHGKVLRNVCVVVVLGGAGDVAVCFLFAFL